MFVTDDAGQNHTEVFTLRVKMKFVLWVRDNIKSKAEFIWSAAGDHWTAAITASVGKKSPQRERERESQSTWEAALTTMTTRKKKRKEVHKQMMKFETALNPKLSDSSTTIAMAEIMTSEFQRLVSFTSICIIINTKRKKSPPPTTSNGALKMAKMQCK